MPEYRTVKRKIIDDFRLNNVCAEAELLYWKMIVSCDREGRLKGDARWVSRTLFSLREFTDEQVDQFIKDLDAQKSPRTDLGLLETYTVADHRYIWLPGFEEEQAASWRKEREAPSSLPPPPASLVKKLKSNKLEELETKAKKQANKVAENIIDPVLSQMLTDFESNVSQLTPMMYERIRDIQKEYPEGWFTKAIEESVKYGKRNMRYIETILERWKAENVDPFVEQPAVKKEAGRTQDYEPVN